MPMEAFLSDRLTTPVGEMVLVARDGVLLLLEFDDSKGRYMRDLRARFGDITLTPTPNPFGLTEKLTRYLAGEFAVLDDIPTDGGGTDFERQVWALLRQIPVGVTRSYGDLARKLGDINLSRAVGTANGKNPIAIVVPCHRVIGSDGTMTGYAGGLHRKEWLLRHEGALLL
jgi:methylated-DNA-[protein]-cysteine S-methyltransferase